MSETWKKTVKQVSDKIFPGLAHYERPTNVVIPQIGSDNTSSLLLQMSLYFNVILCPFWIITMTTMLDLKYRCLTSLYRFIVITILTAVVGNECLRLYLGYLGNLTDKIPELAAFWMLSTLLQLPMQLFLLLNKNTIPQPLELSVQCIMLVLLTVQIFSGFVTLRQIARHQSRRFHMLKLLNIPSSKNNAPNRPKTD